MSSGPHGNVITPQFLFDLESRMQVVSAREYERLVADLWWGTLAKELSSGSAKERLIWLLDTARIRRTNTTGGDVTFESLVAKTVEYENQNAAAGLTIPRNELEDLDGNGIAAAAEWSRQMGAYAAYWPQHEVAKAIKSGETTIAYDGSNYFATGHPVNPFQSNGKTYNNLLVGSPFSFSSTDTPETVFKAITACAQYVATILMPNADAPRKLRMDRIYSPPALMPLVTEALDAKFLARTVGSSAGGSSDVATVLSRLGVGIPTQVDEFSSSFSDGSDTAWYFSCKTTMSDQLGALTYVNREPFSILYHGPQDSAQLARIRKFQWTTEGRNTVGLGHPYLLFKVKVS